MRRTTELQRELADIAEVDARSWLLAGSVALVETRTTDDVYLACDTEPASDTLMGYPSSAPADPLADAIARARAARTALQELDGSLPGQPLAVVIDRGETRPCSLDAVAFAVGDRACVLALEDPQLLGKLAAFVGGAAPGTSTAPFACVAIGDEPLATARHGHRRAWRGEGGPWLGLGRAGGLGIVSTCHLVVDGYGHALLTRRIAELTAVASSSPASLAMPALAPAPGSVPLAIVWRPLPAAPPRVTAFAYRLGLLLQREVGRPAARFSPTIQIPVARGAKDDPLRLKRRIVSATTSVRFAPDGTPEPFAAFEARVHDVFAREAADRGLASRLLAAARAVPVPRAWKRRSIAAKRPRWMEGFAEVIGGRALLSRISLDVAMPLVCAVSSPSRLATAADPHGGCVITIVDDGSRGAIALCGSGFVGDEARANAVLDELLR